MALIHSWWTKLVFPVLIIFVLSEKISTTRLRHYGNPVAIVDEIDCDSLDKPHLYFSVSSLASTSRSGEIKQRQLELNWQKVFTVKGWSSLPGDTVAIFNQDPEISMMNPIEYYTIQTFNESFHRFEMQMPLFTFDQKNLTSDCLGIWGAYIQPQNKIVVTTCVRARPYWMSETRPYIGKFSLTNLMIPGTHDAGSYIPYEGKNSENIVTRYMYAQDEDIFNQLVYGIRSVDLRVAFHKNTPERFWINHDIFKTNNTMASVLNDVRRFLTLTKDEIIILDFHRFPVGFDSDDVHKEFINLLEEILGPWLIPKSMGYYATVNEILDSGKRVLAAYSNNAYLDHKLLWRGVVQKWGNEQKKEALKSYFEGVFSSSLPSTPWSAMAELTPTTSEIILKPTKGLRYFADLVNRDISDWFRGDWGQKANIVATDYFLGNTIIDAAIERNVMKAVGCPRQHVIRYGIKCSDLIKALGSNRAADIKKFIYRFQWCW